MKKFQFSLEALHTLRQRQEQRALEQYGQATATLQRLTTMLQEIESQCEINREAVCDQLKTGAISADITQLRAFGIYLDDCRKKCIASVEQARTVAAQRWRVLIAARQAREAVDKYRQRQRARYDHEVQREEQKILDDLAGRRQLASLASKLHSEVINN